MLKNFSRNTAIKNRIFLGFLGAVFGILIASGVSIYSLNVMAANYSKIDQINDYVVSIGRTNALVNDLKKNVTEYVYTGHKSVERRVFKVVTTLKSLLEGLARASESGGDKALLGRMESHVANYSKTFESAVEEYELKDNLIHVEIKQALGALTQSIDPGQLAVIQAAIAAYLDAPSRNNAQTVFTKISKLTSMGGASSAQGEAVERLRQVFLRTTQATRSYLYLINVVMAGEALEFENTSRALKENAAAFRAATQEQVENQNRNIRNGLIVFLVIFVGLMLLYSWYVSAGISVPLGKITNTFEKITSGEIDMVIPEQDRLDEIGTLSKAAEIFRERTSRLEASNEELSQFAYRTSHDLKAPLISISGLAEMIKEDLADGDYDEIGASVNKISLSSKKLEVLIGDILNLSRSDHIEEGFEKCDLYALLKIIEEKLSVMLEEKNIHLDYSRLRNKTVFAQSTRMGQVLENLVSNAIKYSDPKKDRRKITANFSSVLGQDSIAISDNGLGIDEKYHKELFGMFKRFHADTSFGSGLGLYLVQKHVEKMNAEISLETEVLKGSTFKVTFPSENFPRH